MISIGAHADDLAEPLCCTVNWKKIIGSCLSFPSFQAVEYGIVACSFPEESGTVEATCMSVLRLISKPNWGRMI